MIYQKTFLFRYQYLAYIRKTSSLNISIFVYIRKLCSLNNSIFRYVIIFEYTRKLYCSDMYACISLSIYLCIYLSICLSVCLSIYLSISLHIYIWFDIFYILPSSCRSYIYIYMIWYFLYITIKPQILLNAK